MATPHRLATTRTDSTSRIPRCRQMAAGWRTTPTSRAEVYVQSFPEPSIRRWKVSVSSGSEPLWTRGGRELVYRKGDSVMAATMDFAKGQIGQPVALFGGPYPDNPGWTRPRSYDVTADGERF